MSLHEDFCNKILVLQVIKLKMRKIEESKFNKISFAHIKKFYIFATK